MLIEFIWYHGLESNGNNAMGNNAMEFNLF